ncbi:hypothetical protein O6H91_Y242300 [Diphasiastrum complanatum]|nr:hypothetical protein O6H91_Y543900 [Diphasiastrum complanatum]KAJ7169402.1 hypothetical protein O6H91_Y543900 [Diphasiastrum complanatum]KAJ7294662.1 hypothetical protein O6H91_Y242300 [Diphasiastrum complanatum]
MALQTIAESFHRLAVQLEAGDDAAIEVASFSKACDHVSVLFGCLGIAFKFAERDYVAKVQDLLQASKEFETLQSMLEMDVKQNSVRTGGSHSRNLLRVKRGIDMVRVLFEQILLSEGDSLRECATKAYDQVFALHHSWTIRKAVGAGMYLIPSKSQFLKKLNEDDSSARIHMQEYITVAAPVIKYVENLFTISDLGIDW